VRCACRDAYDWALAAYSAASLPRSTVRANQLRFKPLNLGTFRLASRDVISEPLARRSRLSSSGQK